VTEVVALLVAVKEANVVVNAEVVVVLAIKVVALAIKDAKKNRYIL
jgi:hypothetical protein